ncbi:hypothetical protein DNTS_010304 [Danionella cerebrum]|uniref:Uncharacterized protein n=1 Tax=Danionella cerebrum TaxID=2873325 RepID=A0A553MRE4_9TELE|nr:hypothetical protein DNTS_010304 [Danionella translucida]
MSEQSSSQRKMCTLKAAVTEDPDFAGCSSRIGTAPDRCSLSHGSCSGSPASPSYRSPVFLVSFAGFRLVFLTRFLHPGLSPQIAGVMAASFPAAMDE